MNHAQSEYLKKLETALKDFKKILESGELDESPVEEINDELMLAVYEHTHDSRSA